MHVGPQAQVSVQTGILCAQSVDLVISYCVAIMWRCNGTCIRTEPLETDFSVRYRAVLERVQHVYVSRCTCNSHEDSHP